MDIEAQKRAASARALNTSVRADAAWARHGSTRSHFVEFWGSASGPPPMSLWCDLGGTRSDAERLASRFEHARPDAGNST